MNIPTTEALLEEVTAFCEAEFRQRAERAEPLTQETVDAIKEAATLRLATRINALESLRDAAHRKTGRIGDALEVSDAIRQTLKTS
jgi:hypothetical protein